MSQKWKWFQYERDYKFVIIIYVDPIKIGETLVMITVNPEIYSSQSISTISYNFVEFMFSSPHACTFTFASYLRVHA